MNLISQLHFWEGLINGVGVGGWGDDFELGVVDTPLRAMYLSLFL